MEIDVEIIEFKIAKVFSNRDRVYITIGSGETFYSDFSTINQSAMNSSNRIDAEAEKLRIVKDILSNNNINFKDILIHP